MLGLLVLVAAVLVAALDLPVLVLTVTLVAAVVVVVGGGLVVSRVATLVRFDDDGYQVRLLRGAG